MNSAEIRQTFLDFFRSKQHHIVPSAPMVIKNDPTLMFTNAGMNQFKDIFLGNREASYPRVADTQKCLRVSGKHNDLEEVGHDTYHHTMFEMLGNWSFGDYFKQEAISWAWELLTDVFKLEKSRLYVSVFSGDPADNLPSDQEAFDIWRQIVPEDHILYGSKKDNFWEMGETGPCGPCSEIHFDLRSDNDRAGIAGRDLVNQNHPLVIEIWNLVFIEYNRMADGSLVPLPARHIDTGMGFERLCMVLQKKQSNYDTDVFQPVIQEIARISGIRYGDSEKADIAMRVMADHLRAITFAIADGQLPSNIKAGYVIRRILRRAVRYGYVFLGFRQPVLFGLVPVLIESMGKVFPELPAQQQLIIQVIQDEERSFLHTLETGIQKFQQFVENKGTGVIDGDFAFELFDTYGFPVDLTQLMAREIGWTVDMEGFRKGMEAQQARSRKAAVTETSDWEIILPETGMTRFIGYDTLTSETRISRFRKITEKEETFYHIVLEETPFYAESGGQVGDRGILVCGSERIEVVDTLKENDLILHKTKNIFSDPRATLTATVDGEKRRDTANHHSATHLMHAALRQVLGPHVEQKGSLVDENRLRFDFTHFSKVTRQEIEQVERLVNARIRENLPLEEERAIPMEKAREMGAIALFGEKYGELVRTVRFGADFSTELCGGTHVGQTGQIGLFRIISEGAVAAGIRRVEAVTGSHAESFMYQKEELLDQISERLKKPKDLLHGIDHLLEENMAMKKSTAEFEKQKQADQKQVLKQQIELVNGISFIASRVDLDADVLKNLAFELRNEIPDLFLVLATGQEGKVSVLVALSDSLVQTRNLHAGNIIRELAKTIQGGGGGQPHIATAGGKNPAGIPELLIKARALI